MTSLDRILGVKVIQDPSGVWLLQGHQEFKYSDGQASEQYLERVLRASNDLSVGSPELEAYIKDWPSEYHLSAKRAQLLSCFRFKRAARVLEVGGGCGAITRYLGETFDQVVTIEGSIERAKLARLRTRDLSNVSILCAPFQDIVFKQKFDYIFCIGVYEYSAAFVDDESPYDAVLRYFKNLLKDDGTLAIAIENQFGLKYFNGFREDHLGKRFVGLEGYHGHLRKARTFGKRELQSRLTANFSTVTFYYPFPDYKLVDGVVTEELLITPGAGEMISVWPSRDYVANTFGLWDEKEVILELSKNVALDFFANSFLVFASNVRADGYSFDQLGVFFTSERCEKFRTITKVARSKDGSIVVDKVLKSAASSSSSGPFRWRRTTSVWRPGGSLQAAIRSRCKNLDYSLEEIFKPCSGWLDALFGAVSAEYGEMRLPGNYLDASWANFFPNDGDPAFVDQEWELDGAIELNVLVIRAIYLFLIKLEGVKRLNRHLSVRGGRTLVTRIASCIGVSLRSSDFSKFVALESDFQSRVYGSSRRQVRIAIRWFLLDRPTLFRFTRANKDLGLFLGWFVNKIGGFWKSSW